MILKLFLCIASFIIIANGENSVENISVEVTAPPDVQTELKMITMMFRHGDRTPEANEAEVLPGLNKSDTYYPVGRGQLSNGGKQRMYNNGEVFRKEYNNFLGDTIDDGDVVAYTTNLARTASSALAFFAGAFPPEGKQRWSGHNCDELTVPFLRYLCAIQHYCELGDAWNPIPYVTNENVTDEMLMFIMNCSAFIKESSRVHTLPEVQSYIAEHDALFKEIRKETKISYITSPGHVYFLLNLFDSLTSAGIEQPEWLLPLLQEMLDVADKSFELMFYNDKLKKLAAGAMTKRIVDDIVAKSKGELLPENRKLIIYSGHDVSVTALFACLGGEKGFLNYNGDPYPLSKPTYGATIIIELHQIVNTEKFAVKILYSNLVLASFEPIKLVDCDELCPLEKFVKLTEPYRITLDEQKLMCANEN